MKDLLKLAIEHSTGTTLACLKIYYSWLGVTKALGVDELSQRSDKERYLMTVIFNYGLVEPFLNKLDSSDEFSRALEKIVNDLHDSIKKETEIKNSLFKSIEMDAIDTLETCVWLSKQDNNEVMKTIIITAFQVNYLLSDKILNVPNTKEHIQLIKNGSRCKIDHNILAALNYIFRDDKLKITNFSKGIRG